jgi:hypothetical protein
MTIWALVFSTKFTVPGYCFVLRLVVPRTEWNTMTKEDGHKRSGRPKLFSPTNTYASTCSYALLFEISLEIFHTHIAKIALLVCCARNLVESNSALSVMYMYM